MAGIYFEFRANRYGNHARWILRFAEISQAEAMGQLHQEKLRLSATGDAEAIAETILHLCIREGLLVKDLVPSFVRDFMNGQSRQAFTLTCLDVIDWVGDQLIDYFDEETNGLEPDVS